MERLKEKIQKTQKNLRNLGSKVVGDIEKGENPSLDVPIRTLSNVKYDPRQRMIKMGSGVATRYFFNVGHVRKFVQTIEAAAVAKELLDMNKHLSLREAFYRMKRTLPGSNINLVDEQVESNQAIEDLELITGSSREQLNINANKLGSIAGKVVIQDKGDTIDWSKLGSGGWSIPSNVEDIVFKKVDAKFIIYLEKAAEWERLHEDRVWEKLNCIIISSQGQATRGIRRLLQRLHLEYKLPVYILVDGDPWGAYIYSVIKYGSISLAHISQELAIPGARMLGLTAEDVVKYDLKRHLIKFEDVDLKRLDQVKNYDWFKDNKEWQKQFKLWKELNGKVELAALSSRGITFISDKYIPDKIKNKEFLD
ncbi:MAG: DNA topoisomerase IV subunit A [Candidatus Aenigmarchaeota archaeon]|nr:DNA topoisomerase IV subunit A [Candidatus Aenigmarchaeota archaeon]